MSNATSKPTFGEITTGAPTGMVNVDSLDHIRVRFARIIDILVSLESVHNHPAQERLIRSAITQTEIACMTAVKAYTWENKA